MQGYQRPLKPGGGDGGRGNDRDKDLGVCPELHRFTHESGRVGKDSERRRVMF